jgi:hypothetical protein
MDKKRVTRVSDETSRSDILNAIRKRVRDITNGELNRPVFLRNVSVSDPESKGGDENVFFSLNSLFYSSDDVLCGDLMPLLKTNRGNCLLFGKKIENLLVEDLNNILKNLNRENWFIMDFEDSFYHEKKGLKLRDLFGKRFLKVESRC